ncbi:hypothetical protein Bca4012_028780 [Brassica carinata]
MVLIYVKSGVWMSSFSDEWSFLADKQRRGRMVTLETTALLEELKIMVCEDYGVDPNLVNVEFSYEMVNQRGNPPISISNDRQVCNFVGYAKKGSSTTLCVTFSGTGTGVKEKERVNIDLNKEPCDSSNVEEGEVPDINLGDFAEPSKKCCDKRKNHVVEDGSGHAGSKSEKYGDSEKESRADIGRSFFDTGMEVHRFLDGVYSFAAWRAAYAESINPIPVPEAEWNVPDEVKLAKILPPESRKSAGRPVKRRYETVEDKIRSSQGSTKKKKHKCSRCGMEGHKRGTCDKPI